ncbi:MAG: acyl-protein synthetase, partial [Bacillota bacterium]
MIDRSALHEMKPYAMAHEEKHAFLSDTLIALAKFHAAHCPPYAKMLRAARADLDAITSYAEIPPLPVRLFKEFDLKSVPDDTIYRTVTSSGTTGQRVSRIHLDRETAMLQSKVLARIMEETLGKQRLPMIIVDSGAVLKDSALFSARGAGIRGFGMFGRDTVYALDGDMRLNWEELDAFLRKHAGEPVFLFGFTSIVWQHFYTELNKAGRTLDIGNGVLIHGGGWKKLIDQAVGKPEFKQALRSVCGDIRVFD